MVRHDVDDWLKARVSHFLLCSPVAQPESLDHHLVEGRQLVGFARGDETDVGRHLLSTHLAPAFHRSIFSEGNGVTVFRLTPPVSATGFFSSTK
jgi:hypothetical protein